MIQIELVNRIGLLKEAFRLRYGSLDNISVYQAPGRVNLIGEHTDYNGGLVLPIAIDRSILLIAQPRNDEILRMDSLNFNEEVAVNLNRISHSDDNLWSNYPKGVARMLRQAGHKLKGLNLLYEGNIRIASGLSSSAAIEVVTCFAFVHQCGLSVKQEEIPFISQKAENEFIGVKCGIMDQFIITMAKTNSALLLNCKSFEYENIPFSTEEISIVIGDTKVKRELVNSQYNIRRKECEDGLKILQNFFKGITCLGDVTLEQFEQYQDNLLPPTRQRCSHVIYEDERVKQAVTMLKSGSFERFGELMNASHESLTRLYQVSCRELDIMVEAAREIKGTLGARMTGAGFGGCTINLVRNEYVNEFITRVGETYYKKTEIIPEFYVCQPSAGVAQITM